MVQQGIVVACMLASILNQARGLVLGRIRCQLPPFAGDSVVEVSE